MRFQDEALNNHIMFAAELEVITSVVHYSVLLEGGGSMNAQSI